MRSCGSTLPTSLVAWGCARRGSGVPRSPLGTTVCGTALYWTDIGITAYVTGTDDDDVDDQNESLDLLMGEVFRCSNFPVLSKMITV